MKTKTLFRIILQALLLLSVSAEPRPGFIPSTPPASKMIANYTAADVMGIIATEIDQLPADHPYVFNKLYKKGIKVNWPGAKVSTNIDTMMQIVLDAPPVAHPELPIVRQIEGAWGNVEVILYDIMDIPDSDKVDAILRTINAQTDNGKKMDATTFARSQFKNLLDQRLLALALPDLDSTHTFTELYKISEGLPRRQIQVRREAKMWILGELTSSVGMTINEAPFEVADEAAACSALKTWWTENLSLITTKCAEKKADPKRIRLNFFKTAWDVRW